MADEELTPQQKLAIGTNFVLNSPPGQVQNVIDGARRPCARARLARLRRSRARRLTPTSLAFSAQT